MIDWRRLLGRATRSSGARTQVVRIGDRRYPMTSDDEYLGHVGRRFEPAMVRLFRTLVRPSDCVLDVGANIGCTALLFGGLARRVLAVEPSPSTFRFLERNIANSGLSNVEAHNVALGARRGSAPLTRAPTNRAGAYVSVHTQASAGHVTETVEVRTADEFIGERGLERVDFIKVDVEGFEAQVVAGATALLRQHRPAAVLEMNHWCLNALQRTSLPDFLDQLRAAFPVLLAVHGRRYTDLHDANAAYQAMYDHIVRGRYRNLVGAFDRERLRSFFAAYRPS